MWPCKHYFEQGHFNLLVQFRCKINITSCSDKTLMTTYLQRRRRMFSCCLHICLGCKLINVVMVGIVSVTKRGDFLPRIGETITVFPFSH